jgi:hypothetical protein
MGITVGRNWHLTSPRERTISARRLAQAHAQVLIHDFGAKQYDAAQVAQKDGEIAVGRPNTIPSENSFTPTLADVGLASKDVFETRQTRDVEKA